MSWPRRSPAADFRRDLFHRITSWVCRLPPLRERPEDILPLARHFLRRCGPTCALELDRPREGVPPARSYPGNIRELRQLIGRHLQAARGYRAHLVGDIPPDELPAALRGDRATGRPGRTSPFAQAIQRALSLGVGLKEIGRIASDTAIRLALAEEQGNLQRAARRLGVTDRALQLRRAQRRRGARAPRAPGSASGASRDRALPLIRPPSGRSLPARPRPTGLGRRSLHQPQQVAAQHRAARPSGTAPARAPWPAPPPGAATGRPSRRAACALRPAPPPPPAGRSGALPAVSA